MLTQEQMTELVEAIVNGLQNGTTQVRNVPLAVGDRLTFRLSNDMIVHHAANGAIGAWDGVLSENGMEVSTTQLLRRFNGLPLTGDTVAERLKSFCEWLHETDDTRTITVANIRTRELVQPDGTHALQRTLIFSVD